MPKSYSITLGIAMVIRFLGGGYINISNFLINFIIILLSSKLAIFIHEGGHLSMAKMVGGIPRRLVLGKGHEILRKEYKGIKLIINATINSGLAFSTFPNLRFIRLKQFTFISGGFLFNFGFAYLVYLLFGFEDEFISGKKGINVASAFIISNVLMGVTCLIPYYANFSGIKLATDGLNILKIPFRSRKQLLQLSLTSDLLDAFDYFESRQYERSIDVYESCLRQNPELKSIQINLGLAYLKLGHCSKSIALLKQLEEVIEHKENKDYKLFLFNALAWSYLLTSDLDLANQYSEQALDLAPTHQDIKGTRASVLIETGKLEEGKNLILNSVDFKFANSQTLSASFYLVYAFHQQGRDIEATKYLNFVNKNIDKLDADEKILFERIKERIGKSLKDCTPVTFSLVN